MRLVCLLLFFNLNSDLIAWGGMGHLVVARIAEHQLEKEDQHVLNKVYSVLGSLKQFFSETDGSMLEAAMVSDTLNFDFSGFLAYYHYSDSPGIYKNDNIQDFKVDKFQYDLLYAYNSAIKIIKNSLDPERQKNAVVKNGLMDSLMLRYLLHLVGDSHQPLHSTSLFSSSLNNGSFKHGDFGGNSVKLHDVMNKNITNLHSLWDAGVGLLNDIREMPITEEHKIQVELMAMELEGEYPASYFGELVNNIEIEAWAKESHDLAIEYVYSDIDMFPVLTPQYIETGRTVSKKRIALAGYRLASVLKSLYK